MWVVQVCTLLLRIGCHCTSSSYSITMSDSSLSCQSCLQVSVIYLDMWTFKRLEYSLITNIYSVILISLHNIDITSGKIKGPHDFHSDGRCRTVTGGHWWRGCWCHGSSPASVRWSAKVCQCTGEFSHLTEHRHKQRAQWLQLLVWAFRGAALLLLNIKYWI